MSEHRHDWSACIIRNRKQVVMCSGCNRKLSLEELCQLLAKLETESLLTVPESAKGYVLD